MPSLRIFAPRGRAVAAVAVAAAGLAAAAHAPIFADPEARTLAETRCRLDAPRLPAVLAFCAELVVPEDSARPDGPTLTLFVARVPALAAVPKPDPLVLIAGGPGQSAVDLYLQMRRAFEPVRIERDIVLLDQRGTGRSADGFECELTEATAFDTAGVAELRDAIDACLVELERDPRFFSTEPAVADLDALRDALGVERWNLYGISYGTRVAQRYAARYPERVRAMILDGVVPVSMPLGPAIAADAQAALDGIFARCAAEPACAGRYPDLPERFEGLRLRLEAGPVSIDVANPRTGKLETRLFSSSDLAGVVRLMSYSSPTASLLPLAIDDAYDGDYTLLAAQVDILTSDLAAAISMPMHNSVVCTEDVPFYPTVGVHEDTYLGTSVVEALEAICDIWPATRADAEVKRPLEFDGPVLLLSGELDPVTPPRYAAQVVAAGLSNAKHIVVDGQGHGIAGVGCAPRLIARFLETASVDAVDASCLLREPPVPFFLSATGPAP
ncbi:MAG TPA: alpha/beta hydrolase [Gammaproteobacteria bacterium]